MNENKELYIQQMEETEQMLFRNTAIVEIDRTAYYSLQRLINKQSGPAYGKNYHKKTKIDYQPNDPVE